jgi:hypothetical protein
MQKNLLCSAAVFLGCSLAACSATVGGHSTPTSVDAGGPPPTPSSSSGDVPAPPSDPSSPSGPGVAASCSTTAGDTTSFCTGTPGCASLVKADDVTCSGEVHSVRFVRGAEPRLAIYAGLYDTFDQTYPYVQVLTRAGASIQGETQALTLSQDGVFVADAKDERVAITSVSNGNVPWTAVSIGSGATAPIANTAHVPTSAVTLADGTLHVLGATKDFLNGGVSLTRAVRSPLGAWTTTTDQRAAGSSAQLVLDAADGSPVLAISQDPSVMLEKDGAAPVTLATPRIVDFADVIVEDAASGRATVATSDTLIDVMNGASLSTALADKTDDCGDLYGLSLEACQATPQCTVNTHQPSSIHVALLEGGGVVAVYLLVAQTNKQAPDWTCNILGNNCSCSWKTLPGNVGEARIVTRTRASDGSFVERLSLVAPDLAEGDIVLDTFAWGSDIHIAWKAGPRTSWLVLDSTKLP